jgi:hypothetical protein
MHPLALEPLKPLPDPLLRLLTIQLRHRSIQLLREALTTPYQVENMLATSEARNVKECPAQWEHIVCPLEGTEPTQISTIVCSGRRMGIPVQGALLAHILTPFPCSVLLGGAVFADVPTIEAGEAALATEASAPRLVSVAPAESTPLLALAPPLCVLIQLLLDSLYDGEAGEGWQGATLSVPVIVSE